MGLGDKGAGGDAASMVAAANLQGINEIRQRFEQTSQDVQPFIGAGQQALPEVQRGAGIGGFGDRLAEIFSGGALDPLMEERTRAVQGGLSAGGLTRSGEGLRQLADIPAQLGFDIENLLFGRQQNLAQQGAGTALNLGSLGQGAAGNVANLFSNTGQARSSGSLLDAQTKAANIEQGGQMVGTVLPLLFSDPNLKTNVEEIGEMNGLKVYEWDWIDEAEDTVVSTFPTIGFMADEVEEVYPEYIKEYGGYKVVDYVSLLNRLEVANEAQLERVA